MRKFRKILREYYLKQIVVCWLISVMLFGLVPVRVAKALGPGYAIIHGHPNIDLTNLPNGITVTVDGMHTIIHWNNLDTASWQYLDFFNGGFINAAVLNRVVSGNMTVFNGRLTGTDMRIFMINPAGIVFGKNAQINVSQLVASSLDLADSDFLDDAPYNFYQYTDAYPFIGDPPFNGDTGPVIFNAYSKCVNADRLFLIGKHVRNKGGLVAREFAVMAAGDSVLISEPGSSVAVEVDMGGMDPTEFTVVNKAHSVMEPTFGGRVGYMPTSVEAEHVILAAGDVWSAALVKAYSETGSDAVATVDIKAVGGNVLIEDDVIAEAVGDGDGLDPMDNDNATATINITATNDPEDGVDGGNVLITSGCFGTEVRATAKNSYNNNTATVNINADGDVDVAANGYEKEAKVIAEAYNDLGLEFPDVEDSPSNGENGDEFVPHVVLDGLVNTAKVDITAKSVEVKGTHKGTAAIEAKAYNDFTATALDNDIETPLNVAIGDLKNEADVEITTTTDEDGDPMSIGADDGDVLVYAEAEGACSSAGKAYISAEAYNEFTANGSDFPDTHYGADTFLNVDIQGTVENDADVLINAADDVVVIAQASCGTSGEAAISAEAYNSFGGDAEWSYGSQAELTVTGQGTLDNHAGVGITTGDDVMIGATGKYGTSARAAISSSTTNEVWTTDNVKYDGVVNMEYDEGFATNNSEVTADTGGDVLLIARDKGSAFMMAQASYATENTSNVGIDAEGSVVALATNGSTAGIGAVASEAMTSNDASVNITANNVVALASDSSQAIITAQAMSAGPFDEGDSASGIPWTEGTENNANIEIRTFTKEVEEPDTQPVQTIASDLLDESSGSSLEEILLAGGHVAVIGANGSHSEITARASDSATNTSDVLICAEGAVIAAAINCESECPASAGITAASGVGINNNASVGIGSGLGVGVLAAGYNTDAGIRSSADMAAEKNTASTIVCTRGPVGVLAFNGGNAEILSRATAGQNNEAYTGVCAVDDVIVATNPCYYRGDSVDSSQNGYFTNAVIRSEAAAMGCPNPESTADAETVVISREGNVEVLANNNGHSGIEAEAHHAHKNKAKVGVAAGPDVTPELLPDELPPNDYPSNGAPHPHYSTGNVIVDARGCSEAQILAYAHDAIAVEGDVDLGGDQPSVEPVMTPGENIADVVICASGEVVVYSEQGSEARIKSKAGWHNDSDSINKAKTQVYASDVNVSVSSPYPGQGIWAFAYPFGGDPHVPSQYCLTKDGYVAEIVTSGNGSSAELIIKDYSQKTGCPDCPPCPCEEPLAAPVEEVAAEVPAPVAPLPPYAIPRIAGCPQLTQAAAAELGIPEETLQVGLGDALAINPNIQPCQACASLLNAASILRDIDGSRMAAMVQVFNEMAPADAPYTPEMATSIAMAFDDAAEGSQYASAMEFIDAFVQYAAALDELGAPMGDSTAFVMTKYGEGLGDNSNMANFISGRIASGQTF